MNFLNKKIFIILVATFLFIGFIAWFVYKYEQEKSQADISSRQAQELQKQAQDLPQKEQEQNLTIATTTTSTLKTYRNAEFGFEFHYPENWSFHENTFYSPFSKFNLVGASPEENGLPNPIASPLLVNIVRPDFADRATVNMRNLGASKSDVLVAGVQGTKYIYLFEGRTLIDVVLPLESTTIIFEANQKYEDTFNQILVTFKFLNKEE